MNLLFSLAPFFLQCSVREDICRVSRLLTSAEGLIGLQHSPAPCQSDFWFTSHDQAHGLSTSAHGANTKREKKKKKKAESGAVCWLVTVSNVSFQRTAGNAGLTR